MSLKITVPITLRRDDETFWLQVESNDGNSAAINLATIGGKSELVPRVFRTWAEEQMIAALKSRRRKTGLKDSSGHELAEGDIIERCGKIVGVVKWDAQKAAFVAEGVFKDGGGWQTPNLFYAPTWAIIGNIFEHAELLQPAKRAA